MGSAIIQSFAVEDPEKRLHSIRKDLTIEDYISFMPNLLAKEDYGVLALSSRRQKTEFSNTRSVALFGPYMDLVLEPGEYACVMAVSNTVDRGIGTIYYKRKSDTAIEIIDAVGDSRPRRGKGAAEECFHKFGFEPEINPRSVILSAAYDQQDPFVLYDGIKILEEKITDDSVPGVNSPQHCPDCMHPDGEKLTKSSFYLLNQRCDHCGNIYEIVSRSKLPSHTKPCSCGGVFTERELQYPALGSTAFECPDCGLITFDTLHLAVTELNPNINYNDIDRVMPDILGHYIGKGRDDVWKS